MESLISVFRRYADAALALVYPEVCQLCQQERAGVAVGFVCDDCRSKVRFVQEPLCECCGRPCEGAITSAFQCGHCKETKPYFRQARSAVLFNQVVVEAIHRYKYNRAMWFETFLAELLIRQAAPKLAQENWDWLVPVPLHPVKEREREFNQAERLARKLSDATGIPVHTRLLERVVPTRTQTKLTRQERLENMRDAFAMRGKTRLRGERILVLDDVLTTGATTSACARVLLKAGAGDVCVWTVARGV